MAKNTYKPKRKKGQLRRDIWRARYVYILVIPVVVYFLIFHYWPMLWLRISFYDYSLYNGFAGSTFVGLQNFVNFVTGVDFWRLMRNVILLNLYSLIFCFPMGIIFALFLNEFRFQGPKKIVQTISFLPHFISMVAFVSLVIEFLSPSTGLLASIFKFFGQDPIYFMGDGKYFRAIMVSSGMWQETGWSAVVYLSALSGIDVTLYEAALADGANRWQRLWHITIPSIMPTISIMLILRIGNLVSADFEKVYLMQNSANLAVSEVIQTWVYKRGLVRFDFSMATTAGLFNSLISLVLVAGANYFTKKFTDSGGIW